MWIVKFGDNTRHSAWKLKKDALEQVRVLMEHGMLSRHTAPERFIENDPTVHCRDGHYYV